MAEEKSTEAPEEGEKRVLTPEEYKEMRDKNKKHMEEEIEYLEVEKKYENLVADVEEAKTRAITMIAQRARFFPDPNAPAQGPVPEDGPTPEGQPPASKPSRPLAKPPKPQK